MDEIFGLPTPDPGPASDPAAPAVSPPEDRAPRRPISRWLALGLIVSLGLAIAGVILLTRAGHSHRTAVKERTAAAAELKSARSDTFDAQATLGQTRADAKAADEALAPVLATVQQLSQIDQQGTAAAGAIVHAGEDSGFNVDAFNALVDKGNALTDQWNAASKNLDDETSKLPPS